MSFLLVPTPPRLPDPEADYSPRANAAMLYALRLYFAQMDAVFRALLGRDGMRFLEAPTASYYADADQAIAASTATAVAFQHFTEEEAFTLAPPSQIAVKYEGTYSLRLSLSLHNGDGAAQPVSVWLRKTGAPVPDLPTSRVDVSMPAGATMPVVVDYIIDLLPTDIIEFMLFTPSGLVHLVPPPAAGVVPRGAAARFNGNLISNDSYALTTSPLFREKKFVNNPPP